MAYDPAVQCFADEFDRFHTYLLKQIEVCPDHIWQDRTGGHFFWQELLHAFYCVQLYALPDGARESDFGIGRQAALLRADAPSAMSKAQLRDIAGRMASMAHEYMGGLDQDRLLLPNAALTRFVGKERTHLAALIGMVRHYTYHLGCCDNALRERGIPGVY